MNEKTDLDSLLNSVVSEKVYSVPLASTVAIVTDDEDGGYSRINIEVENGSYATVILSPQEDQSILTIQVLNPISTTPDS